MVSRLWLVAFFLTMASASAQTIKTYVPLPEKRYPAPRKPVVVRPLDCAKVLKNDPRPWSHAFCAELDYTYQNAMAHRLGNPRPSRAVVDVPALGSAESKSSGVACSEGRALIRIENGWKQALDRERNYLRCRPTNPLPAIHIER